jgi:hypothetical protein
MIKGFYFPLMNILMFHDYLTKHKRSNGSTVLGWYVLKNDQAMFMKLINNMCHTPIQVEFFLTFQNLMIQNV